MVATNSHRGSKPLSTLELALTYIAKHPNRKLFPIAPGRKEPPKINDNLVKASNDPAQIETWHTKWPGCNWGLALKLSGVIVVDVDRKDGKHGQKTFDELNLLYGFPKTETVLSPSGGLHYYYDGDHVFALGTNGFGLDIDSPNYVLIAGCELVDPVTGIITKYTARDNNQVVHAPQWFSQFLVKRERSASISNGENRTPVAELDTEDNINRMTEWLKTAPPAIEGRGGDMQTVKVAMKLRDEGISESKALELMARYYNVQFTCEPLWEIEQLETKVRNAYAYASMNAPGEYTTEGQAHPQTQAKAAAQAKAEFAADPLPPDNNMPVNSNARAKWEALSDKKREQLIATLRQLIETIKGNTEGEQAESAAKMLEAMMNKYGLNFTDLGYAADGSDPKDNTSGPVPPNWRNITPWHTIKNEWSWVVQQRKFVRCKEKPSLSGGRYILDKESFDSDFDNVQVGNRRPAQKLSDYIFKLPTGVFKKYESFCFVPGAPEEYHGNLNTFVPSAIIPKEGDTTLWDNHLAYLFPDAARRGDLLDWLAWVYQNPNRHPQYALAVHGQEQGTGKSFIGSVLHKLLSGAAWETLTYEMITGPHPTWPLRTKLAIIELRQHDNTTSRFTDKVHHMITGGSLLVNIKGKDDFSIDNVVAFLVEMNYMESLKGLDLSDRRWDVHSTDSDGKVLKPNPDEYYVPLYGSLTDKNIRGMLPRHYEEMTPEQMAALGAIAHQLATRDLSGKSMARAPRSKAKDAVREATAGALRAFMLENIDTFPFNRTIVHIEEIVEVIPADIAHKVKGDIRKEIAAILEGHEYNGEQLGKVRLKKTFSFGTRGQSVSTDRPKLWALHRPHPEPGQAQESIRAIYTEETLRETFWAEREHAQTGTWDRSLREAIAQFKADPPECGMLN